MATPESECWRKIVIVHNHAKAHLIYCEEADLNQKSFLQPWNELRNALEHVVRAKACELGLNHLSGDPDDYTLANLDRALGHEYRAFFDVCDWLTVILRQRIRDTLAPFAPYPDIVQTVIPNYYDEIRPALERLNQQIADIRTRKDIKGDVLDEVEHYNAVVIKLKAFADSLSSKVPSLQELKEAKEAGAKRERDSEKWKLGAGMRNAIITGVVLAVLAAAFTVVGRRMFPDTQSAPTAPSAPAPSNKKGP